MESANGLSPASGIRVPCITNTAVRVDGHRPLTPVPGGIARPLFPPRGHPLRALAMRAFPAGVPARRRVGQVVFSARCAAGIVLAVVALLSGCATPGAPGVGGRWKPIHQFADTPRAIPLQQAYVYRAVPADGTLKAMLARWARDSRVELSYLHPSDFTLHAPVSRIRTTSLDQAVAALSSAYAAYGVDVTADRSGIVVSQRGAGVGGAPADARED